MDRTTTAGADARGIAITHHAWARMSGRSIPPWAVDTVVRFGRVVHSRGAVFHVMGRREVEAERARGGLDLERLEGVHVVCSPRDGAVMTVYRNRDLKGLKNRERRPGARPRFR